MSTAPATLRLLSGGAAMGLVRTLEGSFVQAGGPAMQGRFGAVGAMKEALQGGEPCDVFIVTQAMCDELVAAGWLRAGSVRPIGRVATGMAARAGEAAPPVRTADQLRAALRAASSIHFPDPERATAGIHFARVLRELGIADEVQGRCCTFPNGAAAMRELGASAASGALGCTQVSEIVVTPGVQLLGPLPPGFELATVYSAGVTRDAAQPEAAAAFIETLVAAAHRPQRAQAGFDEP